jgi:WD40 repeat protein
MADAQEDMGELPMGVTEEDIALDLPHCVDIWEIELEDAITSLTLTPKGKLAAAATIEEAITILDTDTGKIRFALSGHAGGTNAVEFLSGTVLASCGEDGKVKLWNIAKQTLIKEFTIDGVDADGSSRGRSVGHLAIATGGLQFAVSSGRSVVLFSVKSAPANADNVTRRDFPPLKSTVEGLKFDAKHGNLLAAYNGGVTLWDLSTRTENEAQALDFAFEGACLAVDAHPSMDWLVAGCHDATVHIWQLIHGKKDGIEVKDMSCSGYEKPVKFVDFQPTGQYMASSGGTRGTIWNFTDSPAGTIPTLALGHSQTITCQAWQPDEPYLLATGAKDGKILFHDVEDIAQEAKDGQPNLCLPGVVADCEGKKDEATALVWARDGFFLVGHVSGFVRGWCLPQPSFTTSDEEEELVAGAGGEGEVAA